MFALEIIRLASSLEAVRSIILAGQAIHDIEVIGTEGAVAVTVFSKITSVDRLSAWCTCNSDLKHKNPAYIMVIYYYYFLYSVQS